MKLSRFILTLLIGLVLSGCSDNSTKPDNEEPSDTISGIYFLHGTKVDLTYDFPWPSWGGEEVILSSDTTQIAFTVNVRVVEDRADTLQFFGLDGANAGKRFALPENCLDKPRDCAYTRLTGTQLEFNLIYYNKVYIGKGTLDGERITLDTHYEYRSIGINYDLKGTKVEEE